MKYLRGIWAIFLIDHVIVDPVSGRHYLVWRSR